ncbi:MAG: HEAT repeat domain-containing protein [Acidobacteria bacterium]|nr:HEAT repeat domain-containing protein [Acidobacteriota bacterium]
MKKFYPITISLCLLWAVHANPQYNRVHQLRDAFNKEGNVNSFDLLPLAIDAGKDAVPYLKQMLSSKDNEKIERAAVLLGYIGGEEAIIALKEAHKSESEVFHWALCKAVASRGNKEDVSFLIKALLPDASHDWWESRLTAAFSLGILRAKDSVPALIRAAKEAGESDLYGFVAEEVISWIQSEQASHIVGDISQPERDIYSAIFANGIFGIRNFIKLFDCNLHGQWIRQQNLWAFQKVDSGRREYPEISFNIHLSPDENRAFVVIDLLQQPNQGYIYNYVLRKIDSNWRVWNISLRGGY